MRKLDKKKIADIFPLTPLQGGMLFHYVNEPGSDLYVEQLSIDILGNINRKTFEGAWNRVVRANEMLRTLFRWRQVENPIQVVLKDHPIEPVYYDLAKEGDGYGGVKGHGGEKGTNGTNDGGYNGGEAHGGAGGENDEAAWSKRLEAIKALDRGKKFDLEEVPFRVTLCKVEENRFVMIISNHHVLYDGWSNGIILREFFEAYRDISGGRRGEGAQKTSFKEFIRWGQSRDKDKQERFWREYLADFHPPASLR